ncbi:MAG: anti-sigma factor [Pseudooceanicola sp.]
MSDAGDISEDDRAMAGEYVLGLLDAPIARAFEDRLTREPALRALTAQWADDFAAMTDTIPEQSPPPAVWRAVQAQVFGTPQRVSFWSRLGLGAVGAGRVALGAAAAAAIVLAVVQTGVLRPELMPEFRADLAAADNPLRFSAEYDADTGDLHLTHLAGPVAAGRSLEIWLIAGSDAPVSVMVWPTGGTEEKVTLPAQMAAAIPGAVLAISDEPEGGSPTGAPTGAVLATGNVVPI